MKCAPRYGAKGLISKIYEDGSATASTSGNIDVFISPVSVLGKISTYLSKIINIV